MYPCDAYVNSCVLSLSNTAMLNSLYGVYFYGYLYLLLIRRSALPSSEVRNTYSSYEGI